MPVNDIVAEYRSDIDVLEFLVLVAWRSIDMTSLRIACLTVELYILLHNDDTELFSSQFAEKFQLRNQQNDIEMLRTSWANRTHMKINRENRYFTRNVIFILGNFHALFTKKGLQYETSFQRTECIQS